MWHLPAAFVAVHALLYIFMNFFRGSILATGSFVLLCMIGFRMIIPAKESKKEGLSEDLCKTLYQGLYIGLNRAVAYFRSAVQHKGGFKAVAKAVAFLYLSIAFKFLGDRLALYLRNYLYLLTPL